MRLAVHHQQVPNLTDSIYLHIEAAGGVVVEEEERLCAVHQHVVHAHCNEVDADRRKVADCLRQRSAALPPTASH